MLHPFNKIADVLGVKSEISTQELLILTNERRRQLGETPLSLNDELSKAAYDKAQDMFSKNYWSHNSPDGLTPWAFIKNDGYNYEYAGENLARGFTNSQDVVRAWMESEKHKENIVSQNYKDIGFAVVPGKLLGEDTVLVVQMFGSTKGETLAKEEETLATSAGTTAPIATNINPVNGNILSVVEEAAFPDNKLPKNLLLLIAGLFIFVLVLDMIIVERRKIIRLVGHNVDHILFFTAVLIVVMLISRSGIL